VISGLAGEMVFLIIKGIGYLYSGESFLECKGGVFHSDGFQTHRYKRGYRKPKKNSGVFDYLGYRLTG